MRACWHIAAIAVRELVHEKVFYLLVGFAVLSLGLSLVLGQLTYTEQAKLTLDFMLGGIEISMILFSVFMGVSLFQKEMASGSISMILSKPIARAWFLIGKYLGQIAVQTLAIGMMGALTVALCARLGPVPSLVAIGQTLVMFVLEAAVLTAITYFFAVNAGAVTTAVVTGTLFLIGHLHDTVNRSLGTVPELSVWSAVRAVTPDFDMFNMKALASYGQALSWHALGWSGVYAACCVVFFLTLAAICFETKDIAT